MDGRSHRGVAVATMRRALLVCLAGAVALVPLLASARHTSVPDPNDTRGKLDIQEVTVEGSNTRPRWVVLTYERWTIEDIWDVGFATVHLDAYGDTAFDYYVIVRSDGSRLIARLYRDRDNKRDRFLRNVPAEKPTRRTLEVSVPLSKIRVRGNGTYRWFARSLFTSGRCRDTCIDRAPNSGAISETVPDPLPTP